MWIGLIFNRSKRDLLHHLLVHLHLRTNVSTITRTSERNLLILRISWKKGVVSLLHAPCVVGIILVLVVMAPLVFSRAVRMGISCESVQRTSREIVMGATESSLLQFLHQLELHVERFISVLIVEQTTFMLSTISKSKRIHQMLSLVWFKSLTLLLWLARSRSKFIFLNPYVSMNFDIFPKKLSEIFSVSILVVSPFYKREFIVIVIFMPITRVPWFFLLS